MADTPERELTATGWLYFIFMYTIPPLWFFSIFFGLDDLQTLLPQLGFGVAGVLYVTGSNLFRDKLPPMIKVAHTEVGKDGIRLKLDYAWTAELEHEVGYDHVGGSFDACENTTCWIDRQTLSTLVDYAQELLASGREWTERDRQIILALEELSDSGPIWSGNATQKLENQMKSMANGVSRGMRATLTTNEARSLGYPRVNELEAMRARGELDKKQYDFYKNEVNLRKNELLGKDSFGRPLASLAQSYPKVRPDDHILMQEIQH